MILTSGGKIRETEGNNIIKFNTKILVLLPEGFGNISSATPARAVAIILRFLCKDQTLPTKPVNDIPPLKANRNQEIYDRYLVGERAVDLAKEFGVSVRRINKIIWRIQRLKAD